LRKSAIVIEKQKIELCVRQRGLQDVLEIVQVERGDPKPDFTPNRFLDEGIMNELEQEGFFKKLTAAKTRK
jgi:hypothetical protein